MALAHAVPGANRGREFSRSGVCPSRAAWLNQGVALGRFHAAVGMRVGMLPVGVKG
jgi:hypothetical protein